jgi:hypothetical protein
MEKQRGMAFGFRKTATAVIKPDRWIIHSHTPKKNSYPLDDYYKTRPFFFSKQKTTEIIQFLISAL